MLNSPLGCDDPAGENYDAFNANRLQPQRVGVRLPGCMKGLAGVLPFPVSGDA